MRNYYLYLNRITHRYKNILKNKTLCKIYKHQLEPLSKHQTVDANPDTEICMVCHHHFSKRERIFRERNKILKELS